jgi:NhaA family Na+:H+ antiporter
VPLHRLGAPTWLVFVALVAGKPLGIVAMTALAAAAGLRRPADMSYTDVAVVGIAAGIGFTVALFFATAAFDAGPLLDDLKMGALLSVAAAPLAVACSRYRRRDQRPA